MDTSRNLVNTTAAGLLAVLITFNAGPANAAPGANVQNEPAHVEQASSVSFTTDGSSGTSSSISDEYAAARNDRRRGEAVRADFLGRAASEEGLYYDADYVDYLKFDRTGNVKFRSVEMVVPRDYQVNSVDLAEARVNDKSGRAADTVSATVTGSITSANADVILPDGPGFASFTTVGSGQYLLKTSVGDMLATWAKEKMTGESDKKYDYWSYQRKARVTTRDIWGPNYGIDNFAIKSYPSSSTPLHHWNDWAPSTGKHTGDCNSVPLNLSVAYGAASTSIAFSDCDKYRVDIANSSAGDMSVNWDNGLTYPGGPREVAFNWIAAGKQGGRLTVNDYQHVNFWSPFYEDGVGCGTTNSGKNC